MRDGDLLRVPRVYQRKRRIVEVARSLCEPDMDVKPMGTIRINLRRACSRRRSGWHGRRGARGRVRGDVAIVDDNSDLGRTNLARRGREENARGREMESHGCGAPTSHVIWERVFHQPEAGVLLAEGGDDLRRIALRESGLGDGSAGTIPAFPGLDSAERDGSRRLAGDGQIRSADSRQARGGRRHRPAAAGGRGVPAKAGRRNSYHL